jgi:Ca2+-transporting ATPase
MVLILIGAGLLSVLLGKANESISIFAIVILFGMLGFVQEYRAERAMAALKKMSVPQVRVRRNGAAQLISARDLTVGDIVLIEAGSVVPADLRLVEAVNLRIQEAALTGEAEAVEKTTALFDKADMALGDRRNMAYMGTTVTYGRGTGIVIAVGMKAELGKIATMLQAVKNEETPLQQRLDHLGKRLALASVVILQRNALIRKLPAVETLGSVTTICSDKTGTLTENRMTVVVLDVAGHRVLLDESMRHSAPVLDQSDRPLLTGDGKFTSDEKELPSLVAQHKVLHTRFVAFTKGAVDGLLDISTQIWLEDQVQPLTAALRQRVEAANAELAQNGMRVLGVAFQPLDSFVDEPAQRSRLEQDLIFVGFFGIIDPPRAEVRDAVRTCKTAGIRPVMITGDHPLTARYIAQDLGILKEENAVPRDGTLPTQVITGAQLEQMSDERLAEVVDFVSVYARVSPEHKLRIVRALQGKGQVVAMTGDGVNDAPALKQADIGVAMGITGTDVSKEAADMVLRDDNFATIVAAVEEGRTIYDNVRRFVKFSVAGNIGKVLVMLFAPLVGMPIALLPLQLLWLNLLTDGLLGLGMGFEPAEKNVMRRPPVLPGSGIFSGGIARHIVWVGGLIGLLALGVGFLYWQQAHASWQMMIFTTLAFGQIGQALASRSNRCMAISALKA